MESECKNGSGKKGELFDLFADWLVKVLQKRYEDNSPTNVFIQWIKRFIICINVCYTLFLIIYWICLETLGQRWWLTAVLCYIPQNIWLVPLLLLALANIIFYRKLLTISVFSALFWLFLISKINLAFPEHPQGERIVVLTNNIGQDNKESLSPFIKLQNPDIILLQEGAGRGRQFTNAFPRFRHYQTGEFAILSKYPVVDLKPIAMPDKPYRILGARFVIEFNGKKAAIYNIHVPSPRNELYRSSGLRLLAGIAGFFYNHERLVKLKTEFDTTWKQRCEMYDYLVSIFEKEELPFIAAGDFNIPNYGPIYRKLSQIMKDSFKKCGSGWGYTFPGGTRNPVSFFGPWLRIDYIFGGKGFTPVSVTTEPGRGSQHRAVAACLVFDQTG